MSPKFNIKIMGTKAKGCKFFQELIVCNALKKYSNLNSVLNCE